jgi:hypothetical protein
MGRGRNGFLIVSVVLAFGGIANKYLKVKNDDCAYPD